MFSSSSYDGPTVPEFNVSDHLDNVDKSSEKLPNPDPSKWSIKRHFSKNGNLAILINYPDCTNYEGNKILVYKNTVKAALVAQRYIDPHFSNNKDFKSPFARFEPTDEGWEAAIDLL